MLDLKAVAQDVRIIRFAKPHVAVRIEIAARQTRAEFVGKELLQRLPGGALFGSAIDRAGLSPCFVLGEEVHLRVLA